MIASVIIYLGALLAALGPRAAWPPEWRALLQRLRQDAHPGVAEEAGRVWTAPE